MIEDYINNIYPEVIMFVRQIGLQRGDCADCLLGGTNTDHLLEHLTEQEYSYAIFHRALDDYGYVNPAYVLDEVLMDPDLPELKHLLRRYFRQRLTGEN